MVTDAPNGTSRNKMYFFLWPSGKGNEQVTLRLINSISKTEMNSAFSRKFEISECPNGVWAPSRTYP